MFVEELLVPFREANATSSADGETDSSREKVLTLLGAIEKRPLRKAEANLIKASLADFMKKTDLEDDGTLVALINQRFSFEYLPCVSSLGLQKNRRKDSGNLGLDDINIEINPKDQHPKAASTFSPLDTTTDSKRLYYLCSVRRFQTALSTTYRMYLDGTRDFDNNGALGNSSMNEAPVLLFAAKKFKAGTPSQCYFWNHADSKLWKDKNAVGKLTRLANNTYCGAPLMGSGMESMASSPVPRAFKDSGGEEGVSPVNSPTARDAGDAEAREEGAAQATAPAVPRARLPGRWSFRQPAAGNSNNTTAATAGGASADSAGTGQVPDGGIAFTMNCQGMDKLIHFTGIAVRSTSAPGNLLFKLPSQVDLMTGSATADSLSTAQEALTDDTGKTWSSPLNSGPQYEQALVDKLDAVQRKELAEQDAEAQALTLLRSKQPRKVPSAGGKTLHTVAFSKESRVKAASRKNLVVDTMAASAALAQSAEWTAESPVPPLLQLGKLEEGLFCVDFYELTPFQAFSIALAAFDQ